ncbi:hypothetical protein Lepto7375DRAFT_5768 [Leptolyngbya sp. PCC 7375]|nr:hypothetical protein Lepto7375DRAFT_5768 [Leptolyngbya sp. PCC 7375]
MKNWCLVISLPIIANECMCSTLKAAQEKVVRSWGEWSFIVQEPIEISNGLHSLGFSKKFFTFTK